MREEYTYRLHNLTLAGEATVEYKHPDHGTVTRHFIVPYDRGEEAVHRKIMEEFPWERFYSNRLRKGSAVPPNGLEGTMQVDLDDFVYDIGLMCGEKASY